MTRSKAWNSEHWLHRGSIKEAREGGGEKKGGRRRRRGRREREGEKRGRGKAKRREKEREGGGRERREDNGGSTQCRLSKRQECTLD